MSIKNYTYCLLLLFCFLTLHSIKAQTILEANGPGNTYELINSVFNPTNGSTAVEAPDQCNNHGSFGRHIAEVFDSVLNRFVFQFYIHANEDNDRCINFDRQRMEIKTSPSAPASLKGTVGETVTYKWRFRLPVGFQPSNSFTHIHQIKAAGGDDDDPIFTLTPRLQSNNNTRMEVIHVTASSAQLSYLATAPLSQFLGQWVEVFEQIKYGLNGSYTINIKRVSDGAVLINYTNNNILTMRADNPEVRPKWGIYRSLNNVAQLRDDTIRFASFSIFEGTIPNVPTNVQATAISASSINISWQDNANNETGFIVERSLNGTSGWTTVFTSTANVTSFQNTGLTPNTTYYYRVKSTNPAGESNSSVVVSATTQAIVPVTLLSFSVQKNINSHQLIWQVANEINLNAYIVEVSTNASDFNSIGTITASQKSTYSYNYNHLSAPKYYYRLKMVDKDGSFQFSSILVALNDMQTKISLFPNPAHQQLRINFSSDFNLIHAIHLRNSTGQLLLKTTVTSASMLLSTEKYTSGKYLIELIYKNGQVKSMPFLIKH